MSRYSRFIHFLLLTIMLTGCLPAAGAAPSKKSLQSQQSRQTAPHVPPEDLQTLASGNAAFALDLYRVLKDSDQGLFYSPYSISLALAMTYAGARGETEHQMVEAMHFTLPQDRLHPAFNALDQTLASRKDAPGQGADGKGFRLNIVNDIWGQQDYEFQAEYLDLLAGNYGAGLRLIDFKTDPDGARKVINDYIAEKTEQRIQDLIPAGAIDRLARLVLTNAIYFNAAWMYPFEESLTQDQDFTHLDGSTVSVPMMQLPAYEYLSYTAGDGFQAVALPYENEQISMLLLVPDAGQFDAFESNLDAARLESILGELEQVSVRVHLPKFKMESEFDLSDALAGMGVQDAFTAGAADFSGMDGTRDLYISEVVHKSFVKVDEAGSEAAAATAVIMRAAGMPMETIDLVVDRPFIFLIRDEPTNTILFFGKVLDPAQ